MSDDMTMGAAFRKGEATAAVRSMKVRINRKTGEREMVIALQPMDAEAAHLVLDFLHANIGERKEQHE